MKGRTVFYEFANVAGNIRYLIAYGRVDILNEWQIRLYTAGHFVEIDQAVSISTGLFRIDSAMTILAFFKIEGAMSTDIPRLA